MLHGLSFDPISGRLYDFSAVDEVDYVGRLRARTRAHLNQLHPVERRILRWLLGLSDESLSAEEIADRMNMSSEQVWRIADRGLAEIGLYALNDDALLDEEVA